MKPTHLLALIALAAFAGAPGAAQPVEDEFFVNFDQEGFVDGEGTGYVGPNGEHWFYYPNTDWWNIWFYNAEFDWDKWKLIETVFEVEPYTPFGTGYIEIVYNWSSPAWSELVPPPQNPPLPDDVIDPEMEALYIERSGEPEWGEHYLYRGPVTDLMQLTDVFEIPFYNPEWLSIDVRGFDFHLSGWVWHECIPEPGTLALLMVGMIAATRRR